jgi:tRNA(Ile)-lysidine synthase
VQAAARAERYRLLEQWREAHALDHILTAHHADDQLETMIMRINRSSGVGGLAGVRAANGAVLRPLLHWRRGELALLALEADLPFAQDPSNTDVRFDRARLRSVLQSQSLLDPQSAARSAGWLAEADDAIDWAVQRLIASWPDASDIAVIRDEQYPPEIFRRVVTQRLRVNDPQLAVRGASLDGVIAAMKSGRRAMVGALLIDAVGGREGTMWQVSAAPRRRKPAKA